jgi:hypothetical protein
LVVQAAVVVVVIPLDIAAQQVQQIKVTQVVMALLRLELALRAVAVVLVQLELTPLQVLVVLVA